MTQTSIDFGPSLRGIPRAGWIEEVEELVGYDGIWETGTSPRLPSTAGA